MLNLEHAFEHSSVLVVGGAGFVGSNVVKMLLASNADISITIVDNLLSAEILNVSNDTRITFIEGSITSDLVLAQLQDRFDYVFHLATYHGNQSSIHDPLTDHENNTLTTLKLFEHIKYFAKLKKVVYSSAGCSVAKKTFNTAEETTEDASIEIRQDSPYSISKIFGEFYSVYYHKQHNLPTVRARFQNVYGPGEILGAGKWRGTPATVWRNVTPTFIYKALNHQPIPLENNGIATRDFIFVTDIVRGLLACALNGKPGDVYNIGSGVETTILELATIINLFTNNSAGIEYLPKRPWDNSGKRFASIKKSKQELGFAAEIDVRDGVQKTIEWTKANMEFINSCIAKHTHHLNKIATS